MTTTPGSIDIAPSGSMPHSRHGTSVLELLGRSVSHPFIAEMIEEMEEAMDKHKPINSAHEGYAVIKEELDEFWLEVMKKREERTPGNMRVELMQIAAMACRTAIDPHL